MQLSLDLLPDFTLRGRSSSLPCALFKKIDGGKRMKKEAKSDFFNPQNKKLGYWIRNKKGCPRASSEWWHMMKNKIPS